MVRAGGGRVLTRPAAAIAHGGTGSANAESDGCRSAVDAALAQLERSGDPVEAAVAAVAVLEDDPRFNAGTGSRVRLDGETVVIAGRQVPLEMEPFVLCGLVAASLLSCVAASLISVRAIFRIDPLEVFRG